MATAVQKAVWCTQGSASPTLITSAQFWALPLGTATMLGSGCTMLLNPSLQAGDSCWPFIRPGAVSGLHRRKFRLLIMSPPQLGTGTASMKKPRCFNLACKLQHEAWQPCGQHVFMKKPDLSASNAFTLASCHIPHCSVHSMGIILLQTQHQAYLGTVKVWSSAVS